MGGELDVDSIGHDAGSKHDGIARTRRSGVENRIDAVTETIEVAIIALTSTQPIVAEAAGDAIDDVSAEELLVRRRADNIKPARDQLSISDRSAVRKLEQVDGTRSQNVGRSGPNRKAIRCRTRAHQHLTESSRKRDGRRRNPWSEDHPTLFTDRIRIR